MNTNIIIHWINEEIKKAKLDKNGNTLNLESNPRRKVIINKLTEFKTFIENLEEEKLTSIEQQPMGEILNTARQERQKKIDNWNKTHLPLIEKKLNEGKSGYRITKELNEEGFKSVFGKPLSQPHIRNLIIQIKEKQKS